MKTILILTLTSAMVMANEVALQEFISGNNLFTAAIYKEIRKNQAGNFLVSPFSAETVLALTQVGAKDETASEIGTALHLPNSSEKVLAAYTAILPTLKGSDKYALRTANKIYVKNSYPLNEQFKSIASNTFQAGLENIDFTQNNEAAANINSWVEKQTENKIQNLIDPQTLDASTRVILINALYFKGKWVNPFDSYATIKADFYKNGKEVIQVDTMRTTEMFNYYESPELNAKFLQMPYEGGDVSMVIVLPNDKDGLPALENQLEKVFTAPKFTYERVSVSLPKFTIENKIEMKKILQILGVKKAFTDEADLSGIAGEKGELVISDVYQKAFINVTESGTEAAAATVAQLVVTLSLPVHHRKIKYFKVDRPFLFYLKFEPKDLVLFVGRFRGFSKRQIRLY